MRFLSVFWRTAGFKYQNNNFDTLGENPDLLDTVTIRHRDVGEQERVAIANLATKPEKRKRLVLAIQTIAKETCRPAP